MAGTGTNHSPGIQRADVEMLLAEGAATVVLSLGMNGRLLVAPATRRPVVGKERQRPLRSAPRGRRWRS